MVNPLIEKAFGLFREGQLKPALDCLHSKIQYKKLAKHEKASYHALEGQIHYRFSRFEEATKAYQKAIRYDGNNPSIYFNLGVAYKDMGKLDEAINAYSKATKLAPTNDRYFLNLGSAYKRANRLKLAEASYRKIVELKPNDTRAYRNLGLCINYSEMDNPDARELKRILSDDCLTDTQLMQCHFALGKMANDCKDAKAAFEHLSQANQLRKEEMPFNRNQFKHLIDDLKSTFSPGFVDQVQSYGLQSEMPVMVVGLPRAGKTLVEQIVCHHSKVFPLGELTVIDKMSCTIANYISGDSKYPKCLRGITQKLCHTYSNHYLSRALRDITPEISKVVDTMPIHFAHLGFIQMLLPNVKVIHCVRNPMDLGMCVFFKYFANGNRYACDLDDIAFYYSKQLDIMNHWKEVLPIDILTVNYEDTVQFPEKQAKSLMDYLGLDMESGVIDKAKEIVYLDEIDCSKKLRDELSPLKEAYYRYGIKID